MTLAAVRPRTPVPPAFENVFAGQDFSGNKGYTEPHVIMERRVINGSGAFQTKVYTSSYAANNNLKPSAATEPLRLPIPTLPNVVRDLEALLMAANIPHRLNPTRITEETELAVFNYSLLGAAESEPLKKALARAGDIFAAKYGATKMQEA